MNTTEGYYVSFKSLSTLTLEDVLAFAGDTNRSGGGEIIEERCKKINENNIVVCFKNFRDAERVLQIKMHDLKLDNGMLFLLHACQWSPVFYEKRLYKSSEDLFKFKSIPVEESHFKTYDDYDVHVPSYHEMDMSSLSSIEVISEASCDFDCDFDKSDTNFDDRIIKVSSLKPKMKDDDIKRYFENLFGDIYLFVRKEPTVALINFFNKDDANNLLSSRNISFTGVKLSVTLYTDENKDESEWDEKKILISGISSTISLRDIYNLVEDMTGSKSGCKILKGSKTGYCIACYEHCLDFSILRPCGFTIEKIQKTFQIEVYGFLEQTPKETLKMYFQDKIGGGVIENLQIDMRYRIAIITFKDCKVVQNLIKQRYELDKATLRVFPYYSCIGYQSPLDRYTEYMCDIDTDGKILNFIKSNERYLNDLEILFKHDGSILDLSRINENKVIAKKLYVSKAEADDWSLKIRSQIESFLSKFVYRKLDGLDDILFEVTVKMYTEHPVPDNCVINIDNKNRIIEVIGCKDIIKSFLSKVEQSGKKIEKKDMYLASHQIRFLLASHEINVQKSQEISVTFDKRNSSILLEGYSVHTMYFSQKIAKLLLTMKTKTIFLPDQYSSLLQKQPCWEFIDKEFAEASIIASFEIKHRNDLIIASTDDSLEKACDIFSKSIKQIILDIGDEFTDGDLKTDLCKLISNIYIKYDGVVDIIIITKKIILTALSLVFDDIKTEIQTFLEANITCDDEIDLKPYGSKARFFVKFYKQEISVEGETNGVIIDIPGESKIFLKGPAKTTRIVKSKLTKFIQEIPSTKYVICQQEVIVWLKDEMYQELLKFCENHSCWLEQTKEESEEFEDKIESTSSFKKFAQKISDLYISWKESNHSVQDNIPQPSASSNNTQKSKSSNIPKQVFESKFYQMKLKQSDITKENVDAIISGLYDGSLDKGEFAQVIKKAAGSQIETEFNSKDWTNSIFKVTSGGNLPCKKIIFMNLQYNTLSDDILNCLLLAEKENIKSIAIPAFGTGNANKNSEDIASWIFDAVQKFNQPRQNETITDIRIVVFKSDVLQTFQNVLSQRILQTSSTSDHNGNFKINDLTVQLKSGDMFQEKADILVNSIHQNLDLAQAKGAVAKIIREQGGSEIVNECQNLGQANSDGLASTTAGKLQYKKIIHFATSDSVNSWEKRVTNCLIMADQLLATSIIFPALGAGAANLNPHKSANILYSGIKNFSKPKTLKSVKIILHPPTLLPSFISVFCNATSTSSGEPSPSPTISDEIPPSPTDVHPDLEFPQYSSMHFILYLKNASLSDRIKQDITFWLQSKLATTEVPFDTDVITEECQKIHNIGKQKSVLIQVNAEKTHINISGLSNSVLDAVTEINSVLSQTKEALIKSQSIQWFFRKSPLLNFKKVDKFKNLKLEKIFLNQSSDSVVIDGCRCGINSPYVKRKEINTDKTPIQWDPMTENELITELNKNSEEYKAIENSFITKVKKSVTIEKIQRIQNLSLYEQYLSQKRKIENKNGGSANEMCLFHGTLTVNVDSINSTGFNRSLAGYNATVYGVGSYFALNASYSYNYAQPTDTDPKRSIYYCRVLVGKYIKGDNSMKVVPSPHDSLVDDVSNPTIFVVFHDTAAYPEYLITFT